VGPVWVVWATGTGTGTGTSHRAFSCASAVSQSALGVRGGCFTAFKSRNFARGDAADAVRARARSWIRARCRHSQISKG